jgi:hypothetical protein
MVHNVGVHDVGMHDADVCSMDGVSVDVRWVGVHEMVMTRGGRSTKEFC